MFGIGLPEMILIMALALIVVGPDKLPELARSIAKGVLELKKTVSTLKDDFADDNPFDAVKPELEEVASSLKEKIGDPTSDGWDDIIDKNPVFREVDGTTEIERDEKTQSSEEIIDVDSGDYAIKPSAEEDDQSSPDSLQTKTDPPTVDAVSSVQTEDRPDAHKPGKADA